MWGWRRRQKELSCREVVALVTDYLEGKLSPHDKERFEAHLQVCLSCPEYVEQIRAIVVAASRPSPETTPVPSRPELVELFHTLRGEQS